MDSADSSLVYRSTWSDYDQRLKSFNNWPLQIKQTSQDMAQAGFIYTGSSDRVFCFECKVGLKRWEIINRPASEAEGHHTHLSIVGRGPDMSIVHPPPPFNETNFF